MKNKKINGLSQVLFTQASIIDLLHPYQATALLYHFLGVIPAHCRPDHKGNICVFLASAIKTHSSDACLHKQRLCARRRASGEGL